MTILNLLLLFLCLILAGSLGWLIYYTRHTIQHIRHQHDKHLTALTQQQAHFAADIAHELRTPLAALKTRLQIALQTKTESEKTVLLQKVLEDVDKISHLVSQLLILNRLDQQTKQWAIEPIDLVVITREIISSIATLALNKQIEMELATEVASAMIMGNATMIGVMVRNIIDNAIHYTPPGGHIHVSIFLEDTQIVLRVMDTGIGIPPDCRERVFDRFFRVAHTTHTGSGLGLSIVKQITTRHHAKIILSTPKNGQGLQFDVIFPLAICREVPAVALTRDA